MTQKLDTHEFNHKYAALEQKLDSIFQKPNQNQTPSKPTLGDSKIDQKDLLALDRIPYLEVILKFRNLSNKSTKIWRSRRAPFLTSNRLRSPKWKPFNKTS